MDSASAFPVLMQSTVTVMDLHRRLCAGGSATEIIGDLFGRPVRIRRLACDTPSLSATRLACLEQSEAEPAVHRRVELAASGRPVSQADLWYVPSRLWPGMAEKLLVTDEPFGLVVGAMKPLRETLAARICAPGEAFVLEHEAVLRDAQGRPIALVCERYRP